MPTERFLSEIPDCQGFEGKVPLAVNSLPTPRDYRHKPFLVRVITSVGLIVVPLSIACNPANKWTWDGDYLRAGSNEITRKSQTGFSPNCPLIINTNDGRTYYFVGNCTVFGPHK